MQTNYNVMQLYSISVTRATMGGNMPSLSVRLSQEELERFRKARERLQERERPGYTVTDRVALLVALERLEAHLDRLDKDKGRAPGRS